jgi:hypothetical protein
VVRKNHEMSIVTELFGTDLAPHARVVRVNGTLYKRQDGPFCSWRFLSPEEKRARMKEYMRLYRGRGRKRQPTADCAT